MKKLLLIIVSIFLLGACRTTNNESVTSYISSTDNQMSSNIEQSKEEIDMTLYIDNNKLDVSWEDNDSVKALKEILPLTINMHEYGGFEQTGSIGQSIIRNDEQMDVIPGDIVLYSGNQISIFYNNSSWSYTKLGHINLNKNELNDLLNKQSVVLVIDIK